MGHVLATWYMMSGTCLAMGLVHVVVWLRRWREPHMLMFSVSAIAIAGLAVSEAGMMAAASIEEMVRWLRFAHVPVFFVLAGLVAFVQLFFGTGRLSMHAIIPRAAPASLSSCLPSNRPARDRTHAGSCTGPRSNCPAWQRSVACHERVVPYGVVKEG